MTRDVQQGYTYSSAAAIAVKRLERGVRTGTRGYERAHDSYLKLFYYYSHNHPSLLLVDGNRVANSFVNAMISYWKNCSDDNRVRFKEDEITEIMENTPAFIAKTRQSYSQIKSAELLKVSRQTIIHWMNKGLMKYILIGGDRKPLKRQVNEMRPFYCRKRGEYDSAVYRGYFLKKGFIPQPEGRKKSKRVMTYNDLVAKYSGLKSRVSELEETIRANEKALKISKKLVDNSASQLEAMGKKYQAALAENKVAQRRIRGLETTVERLQRLYGSIVEEKDYLSGQLVAANKSIKDLAAKNQELQEKEAEAVENNEGLSRQLTEQREQTMILETRIRGLESQKRDLQQRYDKALKKKNQVTANRPHKAKKEESAQQEISSLEVTIGELQQQNEELQEKISDIAERNCELMTEIADHQKTIKQHQDIDPTKTPEYQALEQQKNELATQLAQLQKDYKSLQKQIQSSKQKGRQGVRLYCSFETYTKGEKIKHPIWGYIGEVVSVDGGTIAVDFKKIGRKELIQGQRLDQS